jgi:type II secretory pathway pseudopilin PulG
VARARSTEGISNLGMILSMAGLLVVLLIVAIVVSVTLPSSTTTNDTIASTLPAHGGTTSPGQPGTTTAGAVGTASAAEVAACRSDVSDVQAALAAYQATNGSYPTLPADWTVSSYPTNFGPLTNAPAPGPFLKMPPGDNHYVILWDSAGHIWVEPPGTFFPTYDAVHDAANPSTCAQVAR